MKTRAAVLIMAVAMCAATSLLASRAAGQGAFPEGPGRDTLLLACTQCHSAGKMVLAKLSADDWQFIVYDMIARGAPVHQDDIGDLTRYLQDNFAIDRKRGN